MLAVDAMIRAGSSRRGARAPHRRVQSSRRRQALAPALVFLAAGATGYRGEHHVELAAVVEFIHTATPARRRRRRIRAAARRKTANAEFGNAASVLVGTSCTHALFQIMVAVRSMRVMEVLRTPPMRSRRAKCCNS